MIFPSCGPFGCKGTTDQLGTFSYSGTPATLSGSNALDEPPPGNILKILLVGPSFTSLSLITQYLFISWRPKTTMLPGAAVNASIMICVWLTVVPFGRQILPPGLP